MCLHDCVSLISLNVFCFWSRLQEKNCFCKGIFLVFYILKSLLLTLVSIQVWHHQHRFVMVSARLKRSLAGRRKNSHACCGKCCVVASASVWVYFKGRRRRGCSANIVAVVGIFTRPLLSGTRKGKHGGQEVSKHVLANFYPEKTENT